MKKSDTTYKILLTSASIMLLASIAGNALAMDNYAQDGAGNRNGDDDQNDGRDDASDNDDADAAGRSEAADDARENDDDDRGAAADNGGSGARSDEDGDDSPDERPRTRTQRNGRNSAEDKDRATGYLSRSLAADMVRAPGGPYRRSRLLLHARQAGSASVAVFGAGS